MIVVTGGFGFIGSQIVRALVKLGKEVVVVDDLSDGRKFENLVDVNIKDCFDKDVFFQAILSKVEAKSEIEAIIHNGAISSTTSWDGKEVMAANYDYSKFLLEYCDHYNIPFIYASSASVYGANKSSKEDLGNEKPLNIYGYSKMLFDRYAFSRKDPKARVVGLRYFNVYGPGEQFKGSQASPFFRYYKSLRKQQFIEIFSGEDGFGGLAEHTQRDFIYVGDVVQTVLWALDNDVSGIYNVGTGQPNIFENVAEHVLSWFMKEKRLDKTQLAYSYDNMIVDSQEVLIEWIQKTPLPNHLKGRAQPYTCADLTKLREAGYKKKFTLISEGCKKYMAWLDKNYTEAWDENSSD